MLRFSRASKIENVTKNWKWRKLANWWRIYFVLINKLASTQANAAWRSSLTKCRMREKLWVLKLRSLTKKVIQNCNVCKRYREKPISAPRETTKSLPIFRVEMSDTFAVTGVDFAGPVFFRLKKSVTAKAYIALFTCTSTRAVHLKLCRDLSSAEFQRALKEFIARRGCPQNLVSDQGKTFVASGQWLSTVTLKKDHNLPSYIGALNITWKFNLARAPWWEVSLSVSLVS